MTMSTLQIVFLGLAALLILAWLLLALAQPRSLEAPGVVVLRYGAAWRVAAIVVALVPPALMIGFVWRSHERPEAMLLIVGGQFFAASMVAGLLLIEVKRVQIAVSEEGIARSSPWTGQAALKWNEVECVTYSALNRWIVVEGPGKTIRVSRHLGGVG